MHDFDIAWADDAHFANALARVKPLDESEIIARGKQPMQGYRLWKDQPIPNEKGQPSGRKGWCVVRDFPGSILLEPYKLAKLVDVVSFFPLGPFMCGSITPEFYDRADVVAEGQKQVAQERAAAAAAATDAGDDENARAVKLLEVNTRYYRTCAILTGVKSPDLLTEEQLYDVWRAGALMGIRFPDENVWQASFARELAGPEQAAYSADIREVFNEAFNAAQVLGLEARARKLEMGAKRGV